MVTAYDVFLFYLCASLSNFVQQLYHKEPQTSPPFSLWQAGKTLSFTEKAYHKL